MIISKHSNPRFPHTITITRNVENIDPFNDNVTTTSIYNGIGRSFNNTIPREVDGVIISRYECAIPKRYDDWTIEPRIGDLISVTMGSLTESGTITEICKGNMGTNVTWEIVRN